MMFKQIKISSLLLDNVTISAPLAGITNLPFRLLAKEMDCALVCSEMISANGLVHRSSKTEKMLASSPEEKPLSVQIFGSDSSIMAEAARIVASAGADILDINFGCSVKKVVKTGAGAALMRDAGKAEALIKAVRKAVNIPLTIKIRSGWDLSGEQAFHIAQIAEACGVDAITIHPRTATQGFSGKADWTLIAGIKKRVSIPVIGNGDIVTANDALKMLRETGCDAIMIGRGAIGNPWIFSQILSLIRGDGAPPVTLAYRFEIMIKYLNSLIKTFGEKQACHMMRGRLGWFVKGLRYSSRFRESIKQISSEKEAVSIIKDYMNTLQSISDSEL